MRVHVARQNKRTISIQIVLNLQPLEEIRWFFSREKGERHEKIIVYIGNRVLYVFIGTCGQQLHWGNIL